ncbi:MAG: hypothetical protein MZV70_53025 [Desulfobacterales bacterium]|nr:hypothetical protein [Desulfobacterales bacterium]
MIVVGGHGHELPPQDGVGPLGVGDDVEGPAAPDGRDEVDVEAPSGEPLRGDRPPLPQVLRPAGQVVRGDAQEGRAGGMPDLDLEEGPGGRARGGRDPRGGVVDVEDPRPLGQVEAQAAVGQALLAGLVDDRYDRGRAPFPQGAGPAVEEAAVLGRFQAMLCGKRRVEDDGDLAREIDPGAILPAEIGGNEPVTQEHDLANGLARLEPAPSRRVGREEEDALPAGRDQAQARGGRHHGGDLDRDLLIVRAARHERLEADPLGRQGDVLGGDVLFDGGGGPSPELRGAEELQMEGHVLGADRVEGPSRDILRAAGEDEEQSGGQEHGGISASSHRCLLCRGRRVL